MGYVLQVTAHPLGRAAGQVKGIQRRMAHGLGTAIGRILRAGGAVAVQHRARLVDGESVARLHVRGEIAQHGAVERKGRPAVEAQQLARMPLIGIDQTVARLTASGNSLDRKSVV